MKPQIVAFLGPTGTHTEHALQAFLAPKKPLACFSVTEVFRLLSDGKVEAGFIPIENLIQGPVTETLDQLLNYKNEIYIADSYLMPIKNALGILPVPNTLAPKTKTAWQDNIKQIYSHEQPLKQCSRYLAKELPQAERNSAASTAAAIALVKEKNLTDAVVIAAKSSLVDRGFAILEEDISDFPDNKTRFVLIQKGDVNEVLANLKVPPEGGEEFATAIVVNPGRDRQGLLFELLQVISVQHGINLISIHSRPDRKGGFVFHFDLEGHPGEKRLSDCLDNLRRFCVDATGQTAEISVLGYYPRNSFHALSFIKCVGIVGGHGKMGSWLADFFRAAGSRVIVNDKDQGVSLSELAKEAEVIFLSVPMSAAREVVSELIPLLRPGQLVVENCSVKGCVLADLEKLAPPEVEVLGIHTMFAGDIKTLRGENVIFTRTARSKNLSSAVEDIFYKYGAKISHSEAEKHDEIASFVQSLLQFNMIVLADVLGESFNDAHALEIFSTPNYRNILQTMSRVLNQSDELILDLQTVNNKAAPMRGRYLASACRLVSALNHNERQTLLEAVNRGRKFLRG